MEFYLTAVVVILGTQAIIYGVIITHSTRQVKQYSVERDLLTFDS